MEPKKVFHYFEELSRIPRESGHTKEAADYCTAFAEAHGLSWRRDEHQNVVIRKPGSRGFEQAPTVMLQGHLDMVCVADPGVSHDFRTEGLHLKTDGDYLTADGTTLGGDDGIAVAMALAILDSEELIHPPLECVFTSDEEIGMIGASAMDMSDLKSSVLLNLDSEDEGVFLSGCAGGIRYDLTLPIERTEASGIPVRLHLSGLTGGHSGTDIVFGRANAVILAGEVLNHLTEKVPSLSLRGLSAGLQDNAIPTSFTAELLVSKEDRTETEQAVQAIEADLRARFHGTDPALSMTLTANAEITGISEALMTDSRQTEQPWQVLTGPGLRRLCAWLWNLPDGVSSMSSALPGLVETSMNCGILRLSNTNAQVSCLLRSSSVSGKQALMRRLEAYMDLAGGSFQTSGDYPAWEYRPDSPLQALLRDVYEEQYGKTARVETIHAGVECGLFAAKIPGLDAVSMGPEILDIHTPRERLSIPSTERFYRFLTEVLKRLAGA